MKTYKIFMPFLLAIFALVGCNTDDLRNDIDELKNRVESLEALVSSLNDNVNALKVFVDGNKTIQSYTESNGTYKLLLSDGSEITLTQGKQGTVSTPEITIGDNGNWFIGNSDTGVPAKGSDAQTPKFSVGEDGYWYVDVFDGNGPQQVKDEQGQPVKASTDGNVTSGDEFFSDVRVEGNFMIVKVKGQAGKADQEYKLPIVEDLVCIISGEGLENDVLTVGFGQTVELKVTIKGDNYFVTAPMGWTATITEPAENNEATLKITAPKSASAASRAVADNTKDLTVQVNKGVNWAVDKIQLETKEVIGSYKALYDSGETLKFGDVEINKEKFGEAVLVDKADYAFTDANKVYFIASDIEVEWNTSVNFETLILIGDNSTKKSKLSPKNQIKLSDANNAGKGFFFAYNLEINTANVFTDKSTYLLTQNGDCAFGRALFDNCKIISLSGQPLTYISKPTRSFAEFTVQNSKIEFPSGSQQQYFISLGSSTAIYSNINLINNIFYSKTANKLLTNFRIFTGNKSTLQNLKMHNNSFINMACSTDFYVFVNNLSNIDITKNIFYTDVNLSNNCGLIKATTFPSGTTCKDNIVYKVSTNFNWQAFFGGISKGFEGAEEFTVVNSNPFDGGTFDVENGKFIPNSKYADYGAKLD